MQGYFANFIKTGDPNGPGLAKSARGQCRRERAGDAPRRQLSRRIGNRAGSLSVPRPDLSQEVGIVAVLDDILARVPAESVDGVVAIMQAIDDRLPDGDGVKWFNRLYLRVTLGVRAAVGGATFNDSAFLTALDVVFANLYFTALRDAERDIAQTPSAWRPLFRARSTSGIARIQFALAGMNAHINRDLPEGIVQAFRLLGGDPLTDRGRRDDFDAVNASLERVQDEVRTNFSIGLTGVIDELGGRADDAVAMWKGRSARRG